jgi:hypothetical protein
MASAWWRRPLAPAHMGTLALTAVAPCSLWTQLSMELRPRQTLAYTSLTVSRSCP